MKIDAKLFVLLALVGAAGCGQPEAKPVQLDAELEKVIQENDAAVEEAERANAAAAR